MLRALKAVGSNGVENRQCRLFSFNPGEQVAVLRKRSVRIDSHGQAVPLDIAQPSAEVDTASAEPPHETNNPQTWLIVGALVFVLRTILGMAAGH
jgi:hypothetical protein